MKVKAVIFLRDHNNYSRVLRKRDRINGGFHLGNTTYLLDADHFTITSRRILGFKQSFITFYYREGTAKPLPVPLFPDYMDLGITTAELNILYTPVFYRILAGLQKNPKMDWILYITGGTLAGVLYNVYLSTQMPEKVAAAVAKIVGAIHGA